ncbi:winged helix-turn-helix domain-containing protein [Rhodospirillum centenum]|uniref:Transcriptional regulator ModE n=1 Tax=Rhodospirillum centenum (strain ATCC 51521 / SW) TaxID=414684 RepID=B6IPA1_RHOCS|nr:LysR family transcriptional regulator [Rhodospirillum centenum]ACI99603.1 transcriptional regulator ModE [Rhodospirillum centenum SW]
MTRLTLRLDFAPGSRLGPGKVRLLEEIGRHGSISAAGRALGMSYRRAWLLVDEVNRSFRDPAVATQLGGPGGGGAALTDWGRTLVALYREVERAAAGAAAGPLRTLEAQLAPPVAPQVAPGGPEGAAPAAPPEPEA